MVMGTYRGYDYSDSRLNDDGEREYNVDDEWCTKEDLDVRRSKENYWNDWADDLDRQDEDPNY